MGGGNKRCGLRVGLCCGPHVDSSVVFPPVGVSQGPKTLAEHQERGLVLLRRGAGFFFVQSPVRLKREGVAVFLSEHQEKLEPSLAALYDPYAIPFL